MMKYQDDYENDDPNLRYSSSSFGSKKNQKIHGKNNDNYDIGNSHDDFDFEEHLRFSTSSYHRSSNISNGSQTRKFSGGSNYHHNKRISRTSQYSNGSANHPTSNRRSQASAQSAKTSDTTKISAVDDSTIALFGAYGVTGHYFLKFALEAGYNVRVLLWPGIRLEDMEGNPKLTVVTGAYDDDQKVRRVIRKAAYVVCMLNDCDNSKAQNANGSSQQQQQSNYGFIQRLVPLLNEYRKCKVLLYQASSHALDAKGNTPMFSNLKKKMALRKSSRDFLQEQDKIVKYLCSQSQSSDEDDAESTKSSFQFIITRPSELVWDRPSRKKLAASKSQPGPFPITNIDLAEFSLNSLKMKKLYNTCPYVVQDGV